jgi:protein SCO1/2
VITRRRFAALLAAAFLAAGCDKIFSPARSPFNGVDITGADMGGEMRLTDHDGKPRTIADFRGKLVVVFFGYTQCPDVCPTTLADLAAVLKQLGPLAARVQVLFVTVDPKRDTPALLRQYVTAFDPSFLGLYGDAAATARVIQDFHIYAAERSGKSADSYTVDHTAQVFVLDANSKVRLLFAPGTAPGAMASDLKVLLNNA